MSTKLTLTMKGEVIHLAKKYAKKKGESLSSLIENYLKSISEPEESIESLSPKVAQLKSIIKLPEDFNYKKEIGNLIAKKYR